MDKMKLDTYVGRQFDGHGCKDIYIDDNGLFYTIPIMSLREIKRLSELELNQKEKKHGM